MEQFWECHQSLGLDSASATARLVGSWTWKSQACNTTVEKADKEIVATFDASGSYQLKEGNNVIDQAGWRVRPYGAGGFKVELFYFGQVIQPRYFYGDMMFCGDRLMFSNRPVDGCDFLFEKN